MFKKFACVVAGQRPFFPLLLCMVAWGGALESLAQQDISALPYCQEQSLAEARALEEGELYHEHYNIEERKTCKKRLVVLGFMAGDNDLAYYILNDLAEMEQSLAHWSEIEKNSGRRPSIDVITQTDLPGVYGSFRHHLVAGQHSSEINNINLLKSPLIAVTPESNTGDVRVLNDFLNWAIEHYPADDYFLILSGHGYSYGHSQGGSRLGGMLTDGRASQRVYMDQLSGVLDKVNQEKLQGRGFALLLNDACLMQELNALSELSKKNAKGVAPVKYVLGTETVQLGQGLDYSLLLGALDELPEAYGSADQLVQFFAAKVMKNVEQIQNESNGQKVGFSLFALGVIEQELAQALDEMSEGILQYFEKYQTNNQGRLSELAQELRENSTLSVSYAGHTKKGIVDLGLLESEIAFFLQRKLEEEDLLDEERKFLLRLRNHSLLQLHDSLLKSVPQKRFHREFWDPQNTVRFSNMQGVGVYVGSRKREYTVKLSHFQHSPLYQWAPNFFSLIGKSFPE